jgi:hypothetical protein
VPSCLDQPSGEIEGPLGRFDPICVGIQMAEIGAVIRGVVGANPVFASRIANSETIEELERSIQDSRPGVVQPEYKSCY